jgi:hypothetical protein
MTKTVRSPFNHEVGGKVDGCTILEKRVVIPPDPVEKRRGVYDYLVEVPPLPVTARSGKGASSRSSKAKPSESQGSAGYTRATPEEMGSVIRRIGGR